MKFLNFVYQKVPSFNKSLIKNIGILHECKEPKDVDRMMKKSENECKMKKNIEITS